MLALQIRESWLYVDTFECVCIYTIAKIDGMNHSKRMGNRSYMLFVMYHARVSKIRDQETKIPDKQKQFQSCNVVNCGCGSRFVTSLVLQAVVGSKFETNRARIIMIQLPKYFKFVQLDLIIRCGSPFLTKL